MADILVTVEPIAFEDLGVKDGAEGSVEVFNRITSTGGTQAVHKISAKSIPLEDEDSVWNLYEIYNVEQLISAWMNGAAPIVDKGSYLQSRVNSGGTLKPIIGIDSQDKVVTTEPWNFCPSIHPVGAIIPWFPGYYEGVNNTTFNRADFLATPAEIPYLPTACNSFLQQYGWRVCDGGIPNDSRSPIWNNSARRVPNLLDGRYIKGHSVLGDAENPTHTHSISDAVGCSLSLTQMPPHSHYLGFTNNVYCTSNADYGGGVRFVEWDTGPDRTTSISGGSGSPRVAQPHTHPDTIAAEIATEPKCIPVMYIIRIF